jgi:hypothetical protein
VKQRHPVATDFGQREPAEREAHGMRGFMGGKEVFTPASDKEIETYRKDYAKWFKNCEAVLRDLHGAMQSRDEPPTFVFAATNCGTRPASDALVIIKAKGRFEIMPEGKKKHPVELPRPLSVPRGTWNSIMGAQWAAFQRAFGHAEVLSPRNDLLRGILPPNVPKPRDPNAFYYKPDRPSLPGPECALECKQWRHGLEAETFVGQIHLVDKAEEISGALECSVHAGNLSGAARKLIPVRIKVTHVKTNDVAEKLINQLRG